MRAGCGSEGICEPGRHNKFDEEVRWCEAKGIAPKCSWCYGHLCEMSIPNNGAGGNGGESTVSGGDGGGNSSPDGNGHGSTVSGGGDNGGSTISAGGDHSGRNGCSVGWVNGVMMFVMAVVVMLLSLALEFGVKEC